METLCGKAVAHESDFDWRHDDNLVGKGSQGLRRASLNLGMSYVNSGITRRMHVVSRKRADLG